MTDVTSGIGSKGCIIHYLDKTLSWNRPCSYVDQLELTKVVLDLRKSVLVVFTCSYYDSLIGSSGKIITRYIVCFEACTHCYWLYINLCPSLVK